MFKAAAHEPEWSDRLWLWLRPDSGAHPGQLAIIWPLGFALGAAIYFSLSFEPSIFLIRMGWITGLSLLALSLLSGTHKAISLSLLVSGAAILGGVHAQARTHERASPIVRSSDRALLVSGWIEQVQASSRGRPRIMIRVDHVEDMDTAPRRVRILAHLDGFIPGDRIQVRSVLTPPSRPAVPGSYDFGFHAHFSGIGGTGYAVAAMTDSPEMKDDFWGRYLARTRWLLAERIRTRLPGQEGAVAAALLTGDRSALSPQTAQALRGSGLGHLLAISGMHMALIVGGVFFVLRAIGAAAFTWSRGSDSAKPAAIGALIVAVIYLFLSGGSIPTQRAFIMTITVLGAVLMSRRALSMHTLALAMSLVLFLQPEAVMSAGFQMSFAAVAALIASYEAWRFRPKRIAPIDKHNPVMAFLGGLSMTSVVAGLATSGFAVFHFHRMASFGLLGNLLAMPVFSLLVMPAGALALVLMPLGLEGPALTVMGWGLSVVFILADWVSGLPGAMHPLPAAPGWVLAVYAVGFALLAVGKRGVRLTGAVIALAAIGFWKGDNPPDMLVTEDGVVIARIDVDAEPVWAASTRRRARFDSQVFLEQQAVEQAAIGMTMRCDDMGCAGNAQGLHFTVLDAMTQWREDCARSNLLVSRVSLPDWLERQCEAFVLDSETLNRKGGAVLWVEDGKIERIRYVETGRMARPWSNHYRSSGIGG